MSNLGHPVQIKFIRLLACSIARQRSTKTQPIKPPGKNWPKAFAERHPELQARKFKSIDWKRHENNVYGKIVEWFDIIGQVLQNLAVLPENVYNMDDTGVMLSMLSSVKVLVDTSMPNETRGRIQKLANAAQISFAERALLKDRNRFLFKINNEAKARRLTRSIVLGKAKVMSFEDLEEAKVRRAAKEEAAAKKAHRSRKRKGPALEADAGSSVDKGETVRVNEAPQRRGGLR
ncbi:hypothetical protein PtrCC142_006663 [Pyrenophora tritici-repentis]|nr:hypothetical protein PtrCC142_006663 [Pyrenophora tritici-repentis]PWO26058.1 hypothetical protein PtrARCrB10_05377 [Pyrenophora tritici-repentis]